MEEGGIDECTLSRCSESVLLWLTLMLSRFLSIRRGGCIRKMQASRRLVTVLLCYHFLDTRNRLLHMGFILDSAEVL